MSEAITKAAEAAINSITTGLLNCDANGQPCDEYIPRWRAIEAIRAAFSQGGQGEALGPLDQRNIFDAIRGAYDLGYNDARNARAVPGDSAPGYDGRNVEADHGGALFNMLNRRLSAAQPAPAVPAGWREAWETARQACKAGISEHRGFEIDAMVESTIISRVLVAFEALHVALSAAPKPGHTQ